MSEIENRRKMTNPYDRPSRQPFATYEIDAKLFELDGDVVHLPNSEEAHNGWRHDVWLLKDIRPWVTASLYKTIRELGYFAFLCVETSQHVDDKELSYFVDVVVTDEKSYCLIRDEVGSDGIMRSTTKDALIFYTASGAYSGHDINGNQIGDDSGYQYKRHDIFGYIDENTSDLRGINLVELSLRKFKNA